MVFKGRGCRRHYLINLFNELHENEVKHFVSGNEAYFFTFVISTEDRGVDNIDSLNPQKLSQVQ